MKFDRLIIARMYEMYVVYVISAIVGATMGGREIGRIWSRLERLPWKHKGQPLAPQLDAKVLLMQ